LKKLKAGPQPGSKLTRLHPFNSKNWQSESSR
jgi:hypothetical protein